MAHTYSITPEGVKAMLMGGGEFLMPEKMLEDLSDEQAMSKPVGSFYSIAGLVAHMRYWQDYNIARARGEHPPRPASLDDTFPVPQPGEWQSLREGFLAGLETCAQVAAERGHETIPDRENADVAYGLAECPALHSAYHLGQIALLRQIQGFWPPAGGDGSW